MIEADLKQLKQRLSNDGKLALKIKVHPGAKTTGWRGRLADGTAKVDIASAPEKGRANEALIAYLAKEFMAAKNDIRIISGQSGRLKLVEIKLKK